MLQEQDHGQRGATIRVAPMMSVPEVLRELGCDPGPVLRRAGFDPAEFRNPDATIPFRAGAELLARCVTETGCEHFGLLLGKFIDPSLLGVPGFLARSASDVEAALRGLIRYVSLWDKGAVVTLQTTGDTTMLGYALVLPDLEATAQIYDMAMAGACNIMRTLCGADWSPTEVLLSRRSPRDITPYTQFFRAPLRFDAEESALVFPSRWLRQSVPGADAHLHRHLQGEADRLSAPQDGLRGELRGVVRQLLARGQCSASEVARRLGMHERTLNRRLNEEGTTFHREFNAVRYEMAKHYLNETSMRLAAIAGALGYADPSAFIRAFRGWSGMTPARFRAERRRGTPGAAA